MKCEWDAIAREFKKLMIDCRPRSGGVVLDDELQEITMLLGSDRHRKLCCLRDVVRALLAILVGVIWQRGVDANSVEVKADVTDLVPQYKLEPRL
jgi:hypothetical protein